MNSELGIRNAELFLFRIFVTKHLIPYGQIPYLHVANPRNYSKFSVGDGLPVPRRKEFHNKRIPLFSTVLSGKNRGIFFVNNCCRKSSVRFGTVNPSPTEILPKTLGLQRADIESAPTEIRVFAVNFQSKIITHYALRITH